MTTPLDTQDLEKLFELSVDVLCVSNSETIISANPAFVRSFGYAHDDLVGRPFLFMVHPDDLEETRMQVSSVARGETTPLFENRIVTASGEVRWFQWSARTDGVNDRTYSLGRDVTDQHIDRERLQRYADLLERTQRELNEALETLTRIADTDQLTSILNRRSFQKRALEEISRCSRDNKPVSLAIFDIDHFKLVNDEYGHPVGDAVLREVARRMDTCRRGYDIVGRWGGEEFVALFPDSTPEGAQVAAERMALALSAPPVVIGPLAIPVRVSGGVVSRGGSNAGSFDHLIQLADDALLRAKRTGRNHIEIAHASVDTVARIAS